jgi:hypothetical protein
MPREPKKSQKQIMLTRRDNSYFWSSGNLRKIKIINREQQQEIDAITCIKVSTFLDSIVTKEMSDLIFQFSVHCFFYITSSHLLTPRSGSCAGLRTQRFDLVDPSPTQRIRYVESVLEWISFFMVRRWLLRSFSLQLLF